MKKKNHEKKSSDKKVIRIKKRSHKDSSHHKSSKNIEQITKQKTTTDIAYENYSKKRSWFVRLIPLILMVAGFLIVYIYPRDNLRFMITGGVLFVLGIFLLPMLIQKRNFGWWLWGIIFLFIGLGTILFRSTQFYSGVVSIDLGFLIGGIFFLFISILCIPMTFNLINRKGYINRNLRLIFILILYILGVLISIFS